jgi:hypothetical protein
VSTASITFRTVGDQRAVVGGDLLTAFLEHALPAEEAEPALLSRVEDHLEGQPVRDEARDETEDRHDQRFLRQRPGDELDEPDDEPEVDAGACDELELGRGDLADQPAGQRLVADHGVDQHVVDVEDVVDVGRDLTQEPLDDLRRLRADLVDEQPLRPRRQHLPQSRLVGLHDFTCDVFDGLEQRCFELFDHFLRIEPGEDLLRVDEVAGQQIDGGGGHPPRVRGDDTLPAEERPDPGELQRSEHHLDGHALGDVTDQRGDERHGQVHVPVRADVREDGLDVHSGLLAVNGWSTTVRMPWVTGGSQIRDASVWRYRRTVPGSLRWPDGRA